VRWMIGQEGQGRVFLAGPVLPREGSTPLDSMMLIRADTMADAIALVSQDPFVTNAIVTYEVREWTVFEGNIALSVSLSNSSVRFEG
jgi:uncharacterized protein YciI